MVTLSTSLRQQTFASALVSISTLGPDPREYVAKWVLSNVMWEVASESTIEEEALGGQFDFNIYLMRHVFSASDYTAALLYCGLLATSPTKRSILKHPSLFDENQRGVVVGDHLHLDTNHDCACAHHDHSRYTDNLSFNYFLRYAYLSDDRLQGSG